MLENNNILLMLRSTFIFSICALIVFLSSTNIYTHIVYDIGIYIIVVWGVILTIYNAKEKIFIPKKIDIAIAIFIISYCCTMVINYENSFIKQGFVLACCVMYFFCIFSWDKTNISDYRKYYNSFLSIVSIFTFIITMVSYVFLYLDVKNGTNLSYIIASGNTFQFKGIYTTISSLACTAGLSVICSIYFLLCKKEKNNIYIVFHFVNLIIQDIALTLTFTSGAIVAINTSIFLGFFFLFNNLLKEKKSFVFKLICVLLISSVIVTGHSILAEKVATNIVDNMFMEKELGTEGTESIDGISNVKPNNSNSPGKDTANISSSSAIKGIAKSNGRIEIWKQAIDQWKSSPIFGSGYGSFYWAFSVEYDGDIILVEYRDVHNGYLELLVSCGIIGFIPIMIFGAYNIVILFINVCSNKENFNEIGAVMIVTYSCVYALVNQLFILDRSVTVLMLCFSLCFARKITYRKDNEKIVVIEEGRNEN